MDGEKNWWDGIFDGIGDAVGNFGSLLSEGLTAAFGDRTPSQPTQATQQSDPPKVVDAAQDSAPIGGIFGKVLDFANKNKGLTEMIAKGISGGIASENQAEQQLRQIREQDQLKQNENARISASVTGLRSPGLIGRQSALRRNDGANVFTNGKIFKG